MRIAFIINTRQPIIIEKKMRLIVKLIIRFCKAFLALVCVIYLLIIVPAYIFHQLNNWQVHFVAISYLLFFLGTVWRTAKFGNLAKRSEDKQIKSISGRIASFVGIFVWFDWSSLASYL